MLERLRSRGSRGRDRLEPVADDVVGIVLRRGGGEVAGRAGAAGVDAGDARSELAEQARRIPEQVAHELVGVDRPLRLLIGLEEGDQARATHGDEDAVDVARDLLRVGRVVRRVQRREHPLRDLAARRAEVGDEAGRRRPAEAVVVGDHSGLAPVQLVVGDVAQAGVPLRAVSVEPEEVRRLDLQRRVLRARGAVDERLGGMLLGVVGHRDGLVTGERADHDVGAVLLHQLAGLLDGGRGLVVGAADAHELERMTVDRAARPARTGVVGVDRPAARELRDRRHDTGEVLLVEGPEGALAVGKHADLDRGTGPSGGRNGLLRGGQPAVGQRRRVLVPLERPPSCSLRSGCWNCWSSSSSSSRSLRRPVRLRRGTASHHGLLLTALTADILSSIRVGARRADGSLV